MSVTAVVRLNGKAQKRAPLNYPGGATIWADHAFVQSDLAIVIKAGIGLEIFYVKCSISSSLKIKESELKTLKHYPFFADIANSITYTKYDTYAELSLNRNGELWEAIYTNNSLTKLPFSAIRKFISKV